MHGIALTTAQKKRFWDKATRPLEDCWLWNGKRSKRYPVFRVGSRTFKAPRIAWTLVHGPVPRGKLVCHECDTPSCINPFHLFLGTQADNMKDMANKGRWNGQTGDEHWTRRNPKKVLRGNKHPRRLRPELFACGERVGTAKLAVKDVTEIFLSYYVDGQSQSAIARRFDTTQATVWMIVQYRNWKNVTRELAKHLSTTRVDPTRVKQFRLYHQRLKEAA